MTDTRACSHVCFGCQLNETHELLSNLACKWPHPWLCLDCEELTNTGTTIAIGEDRATIVPLPSQWKAKRNRKAWPLYTAFIIHGQNHVKVKPLKYLRAAGVAAV